MDNNQKIFISPNHSVDEFDKFEIDEKILVFEDRVEGWIFDVCKNIYQQRIPNIEIAILKICSSCFEMFGKFTKGYQGNDQSKKHFKIGFRAIYFYTYDAKSADLFYTYIRNSIYHTGFVSPNVLITQNINKPFGYNENDLLILNVKLLVDDLNSGFQEYVTELRKKENRKLRENFEARYDFEAKHFFNQKFGV